MKVKEREIVEKLAKRKVITSKIAKLNNKIKVWQLQQQMTKVPATIAYCKKKVIETRILIARLDKELLAA